MSPRRTAIVAFLVFGLGVLVGQGQEHAERRAEVGELRAGVAEDQRLAARAAAVRLQAAQLRGDELTLQLAEQETQIQSLNKEKRDALKKVTTGRTCLGADALRVLDGAPGLRVADLPDPAGGAAPADAPVASDSDVGQWALAAGAQYELCRKRVDALIEWHRGGSKQ